MSGTRNSLVIKLPCKNYLTGIRARPKSSRRGLQGSASVLCQNYSELFSSFPYEGHRQRIDDGLRGKTEAARALLQGHHHTVKKTEDVPAGPHGRAWSQLPLFMLTMGGACSHMQTKTLADHRAHCQ